MNRKSEKIEDSKEVWTIRWQALKVIVKGTLAGAALTAIAMLIP